jgi:hypothetical protein
LDRRVLTADVFCHADRANVVLVNEGFSDKTSQPAAPPRRRGMT